jgi:DNA-binding MarR family transcriptional regulator
MNQKIGAVDLAAFDSGAPASPVLEMASRLVRMTGRRVADELAAEGFTDLTAAHCALLYRLSTGPARVTDLAQRAAVTKQAMSLLVDKLYATGYVERAQDPLDRRARIVLLTERGQAAAGGVARSLVRISQRWGERVGLGRVRECAESLEDMLNTVADASAVGEPWRARGSA